MTAPQPRVQCHYCGRKGTAGTFLERGSGWLCKGRKACEARRVAWLAGFRLPRPSSSAPAAEPEPSNVVPLRR
jgi:hypothetical protein